MIVEGNAQGAALVVEDGELSGQPAKLDIDGKRVDPGYPRQLLEKEEKGPEDLKLEDGLPSGRPLGVRRELPLENLGHEKAVLCLQPIRDRLAEILERGPRAKLRHRRDELARQNGCVLPLPRPLDERDGNGLIPFAALLAEEETPVCAPGLDHLRVRPGVLIEHFEGLDAPSPVLASRELSRLKGVRVELPPGRDAEPDLHAAAGLVELRAKGPGGKLQVGRKRKGGAILQLHLAVADLEREVFELIDRDVDLQQTPEERLKTAHLLAEELFPVAFRELKVMGAEEHSLRPVNLRSLRHRGPALSRLDRKLAIPDADADGAAFPAIPGQTDDLFGGIRALKAVVSDEQKVFVLLRHRHLDFANALSTAILDGESDGRDPLAECLAHRIVKPFFAERLNLFRLLLGRANDVDGQEKPSVDGALTAKSNRSRARARGG